MSVRSCKKDVRIYSAIFKYMIISIAILFVFLILSIVNYKRALFFFVPFSYASNLFFLDEHFILNLNQIILLVLWGLYLFKMLHMSRLRVPVKYILLAPSLLLGLSYILTEFYSSDSHWPTALVILFYNISLPLLLFYNIKDRKDIYTFLHVLLIFACLFVLLAFSEIVLNTNLYADFCSLFEQNIPVKEEVRYGVRRVQSFFQHPTACGYYGLMFFGLIYLIKTHYPNICVNFKKTIMLCLYGLLIVVFLTGTRSSILPLLLFLIYIIYIQRKSLFRSKASIMVLFFVFFILLVSSPYLLTVLDSILASVSGDSSVGGSSESMRMTQLEIALMYFYESPIVGNGIMSTFNVALENNAELYGAESIWFTLLIDFGIIGCIAFLFLYYSCWKTSPNILKMGMGFLLVASLIDNSLTSLPGIGYDFLLTITIVLHSVDRFFGKTVNNTIDNDKGV